MNVLNHTHNYLPIRLLSETDFWFRLSSSREFWGKQKLYRKILFLPEIWERYGYFIIEPGIVMPRLNSGTK